MRVNIYTSSKEDSIIQINIGDYVNEIKITADCALYSIIMDVFSDSKEVISITTQSEYKYIIPKRSIQYIQVIEGK